jgi:aldehyde dehydrogenase (NAD+)
MSNRLQLTPLLETLGLKPVNPGASDGKRWLGSGRILSVVSPINGQTIAEVKQASGSDYERLIQSAQKAFLFWR